MQEKLMIEILSEAHHKLSRAELDSRVREKLAGLSPEMKRALELEIVMDIIREADEEGV